MCIPEFISYLCFFVRTMLFLASSQAKRTRLNFGLVSVVSDPPRFLTTITLASKWHIAEMNPLISNNLGPLVLTVTTPKAAVILVEQERVYRTSTNPMALRYSVPEKQWRARRLAVGANETPKLGTE